MIDIQITTNEPKKNYFVGALIDLGYHPMLKILPVADFVIFGQKDEEDASIVERKAASDFLNSLEGKKDKISGTWERGRLWDQLKRMKESKVKDRILIIEGSITRKLTAYRKKGFTKNRIWGAYRAIDRWGCHIQHTKNIDETIEYLAYLIEQKKKPKKPFSLRASPHKSMTLKDKRLYLLQGLPGVGPKTSKEILKRHRTVMTFFKNVEKSKAVGKKTKKEIKKILG